MKVLAYIMVFSIGLLGINRFAIDTHFTHEETEQCCGMEAGNSSCADACGDEDNNDLTHACPNGCDCSCCYHIMAITYQFLSVPDVIQQSHHYGIYINEYHFEFYIPLFEPPRFV
jgi:hypothetical protein